MNNAITTTNWLDTIAIVFLAWLCVMMVLSPVSSAYYDATHYPIEVCDLWNIDEYRERFSQKRILAYLRENDWVMDYVDDDELDYILALVQHLSTYYSNIDPCLIVAQIAVESRFDTNAKSSGGARGLMQLLPAFHEDRLIQFIEDDERYTRDLFYDERLNVMAGMDYMSYILEETKGDEVYALMWYNQGPLSACNDYHNGYISGYSKQVLSLRDTLKQYMNKY